MSHTCLYLCSKGNVLQESNSSGSYSVNDRVGDQRRFGEQLNLKVAHIVSPKTKKAKFHI